MSLWVYLEDENGEVYSRNITHNLNAMAQAAGLYRAIWRPEEIGATVAAQLIGPLQQGLMALATDRREYEKHNPANGWGSYVSLVDFVTDYLAACREHTEASIRVSR